MKTVEEFKKKGYVVVKNALGTELRDFVTQYALFDEMQNFKADVGQVPNAHGKYADPAMETMLLHLHPLMEQNTGIKLQPTYSYYRVYRNGDELAPHTDRPSCEISATMCFNCSYQNYDWPIFMDGHPVVLKPGDLVIYRGLELEHFRLPLDAEEQSWHVQGFFHYVDKNGPHASFKFDNRESIGSLKNYGNQTGPANKEKRYITYVN